MHSVFFPHESFSPTRYFQGEYRGSAGAPVFTPFDKVVLSKFEFNLITQYFTNTSVSWDALYFVW